MSAFDSTNSHELLLQSEVASLLRCSESTVKRLRLSRKLAYYNLRPVLISRTALEQFVAAAKVRRVLRITKDRKSFSVEPMNGRPGPFKLLTRSEAAEVFGRPAATIRNWCLFGKIPYMAWRPAVIDEADIVTYLAERERMREVRAEPPPGSPEAIRALRQEADAKMRHRLRVVSLRRRMPFILANAKRLKPKAE